MLPPLCGDGMAMALRSAELCASLAHAFLQGELSLPAWASHYQQAWQAEFSRRVRTGRLLQRLFAMPLLADLMVGVGRIAPPLATHFVNATRGPLPLEHTFGGASRTETVNSSANPPDPQQQRSIFHLR